MHSAFPRSKILWLFWGARGRRPASARTRARPTGMCSRHHSYIFHTCFSLNTSRNDLTVSAPYVIQQYNLYTKDYGSELHLSKQKLWMGWGVRVTCGQKIVVTQRPILRFRQSGLYVNSKSKYYYWHCRAVTPLVALLRLQRELTLRTRLLIRRKVITLYGNRTNMLPFKDHFFFTWRFKIQETGTYYDNTVGVDCIWI